MTHDRETMNLIADAARSFAKSWGGARRVRQHLEQPLTHDRAGWNTVVEQGWLGLMVPEEKGGLGLSSFALVSLLDGIGPGLVLLPVLPGIATAAILAQIGSAQTDSILSDLLDGKSICLASLPADDRTPNLQSTASGELPVGCLHDSHAADEVLVLEETQIGRLPRHGQKSITFT
ncbi:acyl-CoA dehydrogenase family protein [Bradyrhizobium liaoningense]